MVQSYTSTPAPPPSAIPFSLVQQPPLLFYLSYCLLSLFFASRTLHGQELFLICLLQCLDQLEDITDHGRCQLN